MSVQKPSDAPKLTVGQRVKFIGKEIYLHSETGTVKAIETDIYNCYIVVVCFDIYGIVRVPQAELVPIKKYTFIVRRRTL